MNEVEKPFFVATDHYQLTSLLWANSVPQLTKFLSVIIAFYPHAAGFVEKNATELTFATVKTK
jgi:hypothetical protein